MAQWPKMLAWRDLFVTSLPGDPIADNYVRQVAACYSRVAPTPVSAPELVAWIPEVSDLLGMPREPPADLIEVFAGNRLVSGMVPYAANYGGHQFGNWAGQLGDGRAIALGELEHAGKRWEVQLKGAGPTPYSRRADGRAVLRSSLRELVCSEAMFHLGVPTTRALCLIATGDRVERDVLYDGHPAFEPGAIVCRVAASFLRFGSFELPAARNDRATLAAVVDFAMKRYFPRCRSVVEWFDNIAHRTAWLICEWMRVGFVHGVMNTDNMSILGLTIDYGPYGWIEPFDLDWTPNITDASGRRYRFGHQPRVAQWNLAALARAVAPLVDDPGALAMICERFARDFDAHFHHMMLRKLGLAADPAHAAADSALLADLGGLLTDVEIDMTLFFRALARCDLAGGLTTAWPVLREAYYAPDTLPALHRALLADWLTRYRSRTGELPSHERRARMDAVNPLYVPRNYLLQEVIDATTDGDRRALADLIDVLRDPYRERAGCERYAAKRPEWARHKAGCSMLSCSS